MMLCSSIASLYNWRYKKLGSLPHVLANPEYQLANAGFIYDYQLIDVANFNGVGESEPNPYFYQVYIMTLTQMSHFLVRSVRNCSTFKIIITYSYIFYSNVKFTHFSLKN